MQDQHDDLARGRAAQKAQSEQAYGPSPTGAAAAASEVFAFNDQPVRTIGIDGQVWFVAADVCAVLEHTSATRANARLDPEEKGVTTIHTPGGDQEVLTINESGLYALILTSRKPQARAFRRWVTGTVLPEIRRSGRYEKPATGVRHTYHNDISIRIPGRYVLLASAEGHCDIRRTDFDAARQEMTNIDVRLLAHQLGLIEGLWQKVRLRHSLAPTIRGGFGFAELDAAIVKGGDLSGHYLAAFVQLGAAEGGDEASDAG